MKTLSKTVPANLREHIATRRKKLLKTVPANLQEHIATETKTLPKTVPANLREHIATETKTLPKTVPANLRERIATQQKHHSNPPVPPDVPPRHRPQICAHPLPAHFERTPAHFESPPTHFEHVEPPYGLHFERPPHPPAHLESAYVESAPHPSNVRPLTSDPNTRTSNARPPTSHDRTLLTCSSHTTSNVSRTLVNAHPPLKGVPTSPACAPAHFYLSPPAYFEHARPLRTRTTRGPPVRRMRTRNTHTHLKFAATGPAPYSKPAPALRMTACPLRVHTSCFAHPPPVFPANPCRVRPSQVTLGRQTSIHCLSATQFLGIGKDKERERERQRIREVERAAPSAKELLTLHEQQDPDNSFSAPPSAYGTARPRTRSERHFSASTLPLSSSSHSGSSNGHAHDMTLARSPSRLGAGGALATRLSGWFAHLAGSTSDLLLAVTISGSLTGVGNTIAALAPRKDAKSSSTSKDKTSDEGATAKHGGVKTSLLDKAVRYLLDGEAAPNRSTDDIWLMGVCLPGWGPEDEARIAAAATNPHSSSKSSYPHPHLHVSTSKQRCSGSRTRDASSPHATSHDAHTDTFDPDTQLPDAMPPSMPPSTRTSGAPTALASSPSAICPVSRVCPRRCAGRVSRVLRLPRLQCTLQAHRLVPRTAMEGRT
ncbi:hypothetical protein K438DRAFT_1989665 [Mycena galopus ATCC 62051]|nr:hypothetical protein K438DRAFT_1989665 [Mycena galopus ATCC 62051]